MGNGRFIGPLSPSRGQQIRLRRGRGQGISYFLVRLSAAKPVLMNLHPILGEAIQARN
jgi:hypothetical protein